VTAAQIGGLIAHISDNGVSLPLDLCSGRRKKAAEVARTLERAYLAARANELTETHVRKWMDELLESTGQSPVRRRSTRWWQSLSRPRFFMFSQGPERPGSARASQATPLHNAYRMNSQPVVRPFSKNTFLYGTS
jgi:hypothetical protein